MLRFRKKEQVLSYAPVEGLAAPQLPAWQRDQLEKQRKLVENVAAEKTELVARSKQRRGSSVLRRRRASSILAAGGGIGLTDLTGTPPCASTTGQPRRRRSSLARLVALNGEQMTPRERRQSTAVEMFELIMAQETNANQSGGSADALERERRGDVTLAHSFMQSIAGSCESNRTDLERLAAGDEKTLAEQLRSSRSLKSALPGPASFKKTRRPKLDADWANKLNQEVQEVQEESFSQKDVPRYAAIRRIFEKFDVDGSGDISKKELKDALKGLGMVASNSQVKSILNEFDADNNSTVDWIEFRDAICKMALKSIGDTVFMQPSAERMLHVLADNVEAVIASDHFAIYQLRLGELLAVETRSHARAKAPRNLQQGDVIPKEMYNDVFTLKGATNARILEQEVVDTFKHTAPVVRSVMVVPLFGHDRVVGLIEFINCEDEFDEGEKAIAKMMADGLLHMMASRGFWGACMGELTCCAQLNQQAKITVNSNEDGFTHCGQHVIDVVRQIETDTPCMHILVLVVSALENGHRWNVACREADPIIAAVVAPIEDVLLLEISVLRSDWYDRGGHPLSSHPMWQATRLPSLYFWEQGGTQQSVSSPSTSSVSDVTRFIKCSLEGTSYDVESWMQGLELSFGTTRSDDPTSLEEPSTTARKQRATRSIYLRQDSGGSELPTREKIDSMQRMLNRQQRLHSLIETHGANLRDQMHDLEIAIARSELQLEMADQDLKDREKPALALPRPARESGGSASAPEPAPADGFDAENADVRQQQIEWLNKLENLAGCTGSEAAASTGDEQIKGQKKTKLIAKLVDSGATLLHADRLPTCQRRSTGASITALASRDNAESQSITASTGIGWRRSSVLSSWSSTSTKSSSASSGEAATKSVDAEQRAFSASSAPQSPVSARWARVRLALTAGPLAAFERR